MVVGTPLFLCGVVAAYIVFGGDPLLRHPGHLFWLSCKEACAVGCDFCAGSDEVCDAFAFGQDVSD